MAFSVISSITGIKILQVKSSNPQGTGTLTVKDADSVAWTDPDGSEGDTTALVLNCPTKVTGGGDGVIWVKRTTSDDLETADTSHIYSDGIASTLEQIEDTQAAIASTLAAQKAGQGDESITRARLADLRKHLSILEAKYARETGQTPAVSYPNWSGI